MPARRHCLTMPERLPPAFKLKEHAKSAARAPLLPPGAILLKGHMERVARVAALPDGDRLVTAGWDGTVRVFSAATGESLRTLCGHGDGVLGLVALGGDVVASGDIGGGLRVWDAGSGAAVYTAQLGRAVCALAALPGGLFVAGVDCDLVFFSHCGGRDVAQTGSVEKAHAKVIWDVAVFGARFVTASSDMTAAVWNADSRQRVAVLRPRGIDVTCVAMDARHIVTGSLSSEVRVYDAATFKCCRVLRVHSDLVQSVVLVDAAHVLSCAWDCTVQITALASGKRVARIKLPYTLRCVCSSVSKGGWIAVAGSVGAVVLFPPPPVAGDIEIFRDAAAAMYLASRTRIVQLALAVAGQQRR
jgi:WD40 repeat protein